ncbi:hypothetical protein N6H14_16885 [Paenibacillus sp. CC-CFT747]|nr:hypothetical protein N6H14_16885 [Paenibacillus sp. CC-CFT747]
MMVCAVTAAAALGATEVLSKERKSRSAVPPQPSPAAVIVNLPKAEAAPPDGPALPAKAVQADGAGPKPAVTVPPGTAQSPGKPADPKPSATPAVTGSPAPSLEPLATPQPSAAPAKPQTGEGLILPPIRQRRWPSPSMTAPTASTLRKYSIS